MRRNKLDGRGNHPWKAEITEDGTAAIKTVIDSWYTTVYEPDFDSLGS